MATSEGLFYTYGSDSLLEARRRILASSLAVSKERVSGGKSRLKEELFDGTTSTGVQSLWESHDAISHSQVGDTRPLSNISLSPVEPLVAVAGWSGDVNVFSLRSNDLSRVTTSFKGHTDRCSSVAWNPSAESSDGIHLASGGCDSKIMLWSMSSCNGPRATILGHESRINRLAFHPVCSNLLISTSDDETWRLWDVAAGGQELLLQEGHASAVFGLAMHPDGSLVATSDTVGIIRVWDLRSGRSVIAFEGHAEQVVGLDFSPNGFHLASCSGDNTAKIWDMRKKLCTESLAWHEKLVSAVKFDKQRGDLLMTASYDCVVKVCRTSDFKVIKNLPIHESRIMAADFAADGSHVVTACYDRTFKVWRPDVDVVKEDRHNVKMELGD